MDCYGHTAATCSEGYDYLIDNGNSLCKYTIVRDGQIVDDVRCEVLDVATLQEDDEHYPMRRCVAATSRALDSSVCDWISARASLFINVDAFTPMPITINYSTPATLGADRIAAAAGAAVAAPGRACVVIDCGTALTIDFLDADRRYLGGSISPGVRLRLQSLHHYTDRLPLVEMKGETPEIGHDTDTAIRSGAIRGVAAEIDAAIDRWQSVHPDVRTFITGGDRDVVAPFCRHVLTAAPRLVADGLLSILKYNLQSQNNKQ